MAKRRSTREILDWLGIRAAPDLTGSRRLGRSLGFLLQIIALALVLGGLAALVQFLIAAFSWPVNDAAMRNIGLVLVGVFGAPFVAWRSIVAQKQADTAERGLLAERITNAIEQLGSEKVAVRTGAIYVLESIMLDSEASRVRLWTILNAYLKDQQQQETVSETDGDEPPELREDLQAALTVITRNAG